MGVLSYRLPLSYGAAERKPKLVFRFSIRVLLLFFSLMAFGLTGLRAQPRASKEYQVKAAFLLSFAQFVEWPSNSFADASAPITIGVLGDDPFGSSMDETVNGETVRGRKVVLLRSHQIAELKSCQLLFVSKSEKVRLGEILSNLDSEPILTVSETESFTRRGGIINFYLEGAKIRFEINPVAAQRRGLKLSSQLLSLGKIVNSDTAK